MLVKYTIKQENKLVLAYQYSCKNQKKGENMKVKSKTSSTVMVEFSTEEYDAFIQLLQMKSSLKDYKGGK